MGLCLFLVAKAGDGVTEISDGGSCPLVDVLLHGLEVIPECNTVAKSLRVGLNLL